MNLHFEQLKTIGVVISSLGIDSSAESSLGFDAIRSNKEYQSDRRNLLTKVYHWEEDCLVEFVLSSMQQQKCKL